MNKISVFTFILVIFFSCENTKKKKQKTHLKSEYKEIITNSYVISKPLENFKEVLVLFPGFSHKAEDTKQEFKINKIAKQNSIAVVYMNFNHKLWLEKNEKLKLSKQLQNLFLENELPTNNIYIGGYSSGGNVSLIISSFLNENKEYNLMPKGVFIVDSPIDLIALYQSSKKNLKKNFSEVSINESSWIIETLEKQIGNPKNDILKYQQLSTFTSETNNIDNLIGLKNTNIRLYTEPDTLWWKKNRMADYDQLNSSHIKKLSKKLKESGFNQVEYIATVNKGYRANGDRHPHSWSIVDKQELIKWITQ